MRTMCKSMEELCAEIAAEEVQATQEKTVLALLAGGKLSYKEIADSTAISIDRVQELASAQ